MIFDIWKIAETYLNNFAKQEGFCFRKRRCITDSKDHTIVRKRTYKCSYAYLHETEKAILEENRSENDWVFLAY